MYRVNREKKLTLQERSAIVAHTTAGMSIRAISRAVGCSRSTVDHWQQRYQLTGNVLRQKGTGLRNKKTTYSQDLAIRRAAENKPISTASNFFSIFFLLYSLLMYFSFGLLVMVY